MNIRDFEYLAAIADHLHFGRAAAQCHVSQPALSMQIAKLEAQWGVQVFERDRKRVRLTPDGQKIIDRVRAVLREVAAIADVAQSSKNPMHGTLRLGVFPTLAPYFLPQCIPSLHRRYPDLKLQLVEEKTDTLRAMLDDGTLDAALLALPADNGTLAFTHLFDDPFYLAVAKDHPFAKRKTVHADDLSQLNLLLLEEGHCLRAQALQVCRLSGTREAGEFRATSLETLRHMVASSDAATLMPRIAMRKGDGLVYIPFAGKKMGRAIGMVWRKSSPRVAVIAAVAQHLKAHEPA